MASELDLGDLPLIRGALLRPRRPGHVAGVLREPERVRERLRIERLDNGLTVALAPSSRAPVVATALWYRAGTRDEPEGRGGTAHFLEHMMFKGSPRFGPGEVDRRTQVLGGGNNAFTGHDVTAYYFEFAADRWRAALEMEADRMAELTLDPEEVERERRVILEEIAMYEDDPWDALSQRIERALYAPHPYGRPVLGTGEELLATGADELRDFHRRFYTPANAVLVVAGDLGEPDAALEAVAETFGAVPPGPGAPERSAAPPRRALGEAVRIERRKGEMARMLLALPGPAGEASDLPALRVAAALLGLGRSSRLFRSLVDEEQLCLWVAAGTAEAPDPGSVTVSGELVPGSEPEKVEEAVRRQVAELAATPPAAEEVARAREVLLTDWTFGREKTVSRALATGSDLILYRPGWSEESWEAVAAVEPEEVRRVAERYLALPLEEPPGGPAGVWGWSLPALGAAPGAAAGGATEGSEEDTP